MMLGELVIDLDTRDVRGFFGIVLGGIDSVGGAEREDLR